MEYYTSRPENVYLENGTLVITARMEAYTGPDHVQQPYTSARLQTKGKFEQRHARFEARIKIPSGQGMWPAFWMLGNDHDKIGWPACGEIDIMENIGKESFTVHGTLHGAGYGPRGVTAAYSLPNGKKLPTISICLRWSGSPGRFAFMLTASCTPRTFRRTLRLARVGPLTIRSTFSSTSQLGRVAVISR